MLELPQSTSVKRPLPKAQIYQKFELKASQRDAFDADVAKMEIVNFIPPPPPHHPRCLSPAFRLQPKAPVQCRAFQCSGGFLFCLSLGDKKANLPQKIPVLLSLSPSVLSQLPKKL